MDDDSLSWVGQLVFCKPGWSKAKRLTRTVDGTRCFAHVPSQFQLGRGISGLTRMSWEATRFRGYADAKQFATGNRIALNGSIHT